MAKASPKAPAPRTPAVSKITFPLDLLPRARLIVKRKHHSMVDGLALKPGERVVIVSDSTLDPMVAEAFKIAIREARGEVDVIQLEGFPKMTDAGELVDAMFSNNWWPEWVWDAVKEADILMQGAFLKLPHTPNIPVARKGKPRIVDMEWTSDLLAGPYEEYPTAIRDAIDKKTWDMLSGASKIEAIDLEGTQLSWTLTPDVWRKEAERLTKREGLPYIPGHLIVPFPPRDLEGVMVSSSLTFGGPIEPIKMHLKGRQVTKIEGGGKFAARMKRSFDQYKDLHFPENPAPGANWLSTFGICTNPKASRSPAWSKMAGSGRMHAWAFGHRRSGVIHSAIGEALVNPKYKVIRHFDLYFTTLIADGRKVMDRGRPVAMDDPAVRKVAAKYGDPDELLTEDWIPAIKGVNA